MPKRSFATVSNKFDSLSCFCDANSSVYNCKQQCPPANSTSSTTHYNCLRQPNNYCTVNFLVGSNGTATTPCRRRPLLKLLSVTEGLHYYNTCTNSKVKSPNFGHALIPVTSATNLSFSRTRKRGVCRTRYCLSV